MTTAAKFFSSAQAPPAAVVAQAFAAALEAAEAFAGATAPNPPVGCAAVDAQGRLLACAAHERAGEAHAEAAVIDACRRDGLAGRIHTLVVTLEPCNHHGRTPPCAEAVLQTPAEAVWIGAPDPNSGVAGGGAARLAAAGLSVAAWDALAHPEAAALARAARRLIAPFKVRCEQGRPWLTVKQAIARDGGMIAPGGRGTFTSQSSLTLAHQLRRRADAIITGSGCILADDPAFTVRHAPDHAGKRRMLGVLDRRRRVPAAYLAAATVRGFEVLVRDDLDGLLAELAERGALEALVEAGPTLRAAFLARDLWDEQVVIRQAPAPGEPDRVDVIVRPTA
jgi:diaminohydroxyphosphoribosylaminopyrimidine deaminase/5-amino-6-(5-phosphoribosylamino)uracil reductase